LPAAVAAQGRHTIDSAALRRLQSETGGAARVGVHSATGAARSVRLERGASGALATGRAVSAQEKQQQSLAFLRKYAGLFGIENPEAQLRLERSRADRLGETHLVWRQFHRGVPVFAGQLRTHFSSNHQLKAVSGTFVPAITLDITPARTAESAASLAVGVVGGERPDRAATLWALPATLVVYREGLARGEAGEDHLAWEVEVTNRLDVRQFVYVDAHTGKIIDRISGIHDELFRRIYDGHGLEALPSNYPGGVYWSEGQRFPTVASDANLLIVGTKEAYDLFKNAFGVDSYDGKGAVMDGVFNGGIGCANAFWNGTLTYFCPGLATDDVVAHEWGHAYTEYTHNLIYAWQPGALNEAYSDIWGEVVDRINARDLLPRDGLSRSATECSTNTPPVATLRINSPTAIAGDYPAQSASFGPPLSQTGVTGSVVAALDAADAAGPSTFDGCSAFSNAADVSGKIALVNRGSCFFTVKVANAQSAGAIAVIVANNGPSGMAPMGGADPAVTIPSVGSMQADGNRIRTALEQGPVEVTLLARKGTDPSVRWLMGEDTTAPGLTVALRDMWNPTCAGHPGKVSDVAYYECSTADNGGVHINSGVVNHAFALLVDGGAYNGRTVAQIGLTKAAHIYFRAQSEYQVLDSDFPAHADALEASCGDLLGQPLTALSGGPSAEVISEADCAAVSSAIAAVELRTPPTFCNFQRLLLAGTPALCGGGTTGEAGQASIFSETFDVEPTSTWTVTSALSPDFPPRDWTRVSGLPDGRAGSAFFAADPHVGKCEPGADATGVTHLDSPVIRLPATTHFARLRFQHYVATEAQFDGGNLKVRVNGGPWQQILAGDFSFNPYNLLLLTADENNSNPMAGEQAFSGTDNGKAAGGSWAYSLVNLARFARGGDTVQLRWDFGTDCADGALGWFVDDVSVASCTPVVPTVSVADITIEEGNDNRAVGIPVRLSAATVETVRVSFTVHAGTATEGADYLPIAGGVLTFPRGVTTANVVLTLKGDTVPEPSETLTIRLTGAANATLAADRDGVVTIANDDTKRPKG
ncbi:MAG TPA: M4 family metallopeptidase, partial [Myxococcaceae bacterium]|nr:M4 family metallopeptidase [Myxococcaceae bacterium]